MPKNFEKPALSVSQQIALLESRGLIISDKKFASHHLNFISYYRFCGYGIEFENIASKEKNYKQDTTFEQILDCYIFDRKPRLLVIDAIERIEIAIRTVIINQLSLKYGAHWYLEKSIFLKNFKHEELLKTIQNNATLKNKERFIQHYFSKYSHPKLPPIWMVAEILSLGVWSMIFANLKERSDQKNICSYFGINYKVMTSWLHSITYLRNLCAHHAMLWNRSFTLKPAIANNYKIYLENNSKFSAQAAILKILVDTIYPKDNWGICLQNLIKEHPEINTANMGFKDGWWTDIFWNISYYKDYKFSNNFENTCIVST